MGNVITTCFGFKTLEDRVWDKCRPWWPHKNLYTGKRMNPFAKALRSRMESPYGPVSVSYMEYVAYWTTEEELIIQTLKGNA